MDEYIDGLIDEYLFGWVNELMIGLSVTLILEPDTRPSKCHNFYTAMISGEKEFKPKSAYNFIKLKL